MKIKNIPLQRPPKVKHFTGRKKELEKLIKDLQPGKIITLCGPGGIGKSALASQAIWELSPKPAPDYKPPERFPDGVIWHDFYKDPQSNKALENIALSFNNNPRPSPIEAAKRALSGKQVLILLDSAEEADDLSLILNLLDNCCALVTTRNKYDACAQIYDMQSLPTDEAVKLFQAWSKNADETKSVQTICELTGGLPLAIRLVGKYIFETAKPVSEYIEYLEKKIGQKDRKLLSESVLVNHLLKRSLNHVSYDAERIFEIAGILSFSSFSKDLIQAALNGTKIKKTINELINYGLLNRTDNKRFILSHALIHTYAYMNHGPLNNTFEGILEYYNSYVIEHRKQSPESFELLDMETAHIIRIIEECNKYTYRDLSLIDKAISISREIGDRRNECISLINLGNAYRNLGQIEKAIKYYEQVLSISRETGHRRGESFCLSNLADAYRDLGQIEKGIKYYEQSLSISREIGHRQLEGISLRNLGDVYIAKGQIEKAIDFYERSLSISREIGLCLDDKLDEKLGDAYRDLGQIKKALEYYKKALYFGDDQDEAIVFGKLEDANKDLGRIEKANGYHEKALSIKSEIESEHHASMQIWLDDIAEILKSGKQVKPQEVIDAVKSRHQDNEVDPIIADYLADLLDQKLQGKSFKGGRYVNSTPSVDRMFRDPEIYERNEKLRADGISYEKRLSKLSKAFHLGEKNIEAIISKEKKKKLLNSEHLTSFDDLFAI